MEDREHAWKPAKLGESLVCFARRQKAVKRECIQSNASAINVTSKTDKITFKMKKSLTLEGLLFQLQKVYFNFIAIVFYCNFFSAQTSSLKKAISRTDCTTVFKML